MSAANRIGVDQTLVIVASSIVGAILLAAVVGYFLLARKYRHHHQEIKDEFSELASCEKQDKNDDPSRRHPQAITTTTTTTTTTPTDVNEKLSSVMVPIVIPLTSAPLPPVPRSPIPQLVQVADRIQKGEAIESGKRPSPNPHAMIMSRMSTEDDEGIDIYLCQSVPVTESFYTDLDTGLK
ncbi:hypothetical protein BGZ65_010359, partial [Modicella reniformis]